MTISADLAADLLTNGLALGALLVAILALRRRGGAPAERRLRRLLVGLALLLVLRMINWTAPQHLLAIPVTIIAAWLPLLALRLVEELVRRHAPALLKRVALGGALLLGAAALPTGAFFPRELMIALAAFQAIMLAWILVFLASARTDQLAPAETRLADAFGLALLVAIPFALSDFRGDIPGPPVRMGGLGVLAFVVTTSRIASGAGSPRLVLADVAGLLACGAVVAGAAWLVIPGVTPLALWQLFTIAAAAAAVMVIGQRFGDARRAERRDLSVAAALAQLPDRPDQDSLIAAHPLTASAAVVDGAALHLYDADVIAALTEHRIVRGTTPLAPAASAAAQNLLAEYAATHLVRLSHDPPRFLALNVGQLGSAAMLDTELDMFARLADRSA